MIEIVIKYDAGKFLVYEPTTDTLMACTNLTEALTALNDFLKSSGMSNVDILENPNISYHIDSHTMKSIVEGNVNLLKRLNQAPSGFMISEKRFGVSNDKGSKNSGTTLSGATGFSKSMKKFGGNKNL